MKYYKKSLIAMLCSVIVISSYFFIAAYVHDPLQVFHTPWGRKTTFVSNMREQALGIIKFREFDSVIIGNSLFENSSGVEAEEKLGGNFVNLSSSGMRYFERYTILNYAFSKKNLKTAILQFDAFLDAANISSAAFVPEAYQDGITNQIELYGNTKFLKCILFWSKSKKCVGTPKDLRMPNAWIEKDEFKRLFGGYDNWLKYKDTEELKMLHNVLADKNTIKVSAKEFAGFENTMKNYVLDLVKNKKETDFHIIIPPYSILFWQNPVEYKINLDDYLRVVETLLTETKGMDNVTVYWFYDSSFIEDISEYKDETHYSPKMNSMFIDAIAKQHNVITTNNMYELFQDLKNRVNAFDNSEYVRMLENELENREE